MHYNGNPTGEAVKSLCKAIHRDGELRAILETKPTVYMTGISGMTVGFPLACKYETEYAVLRKQGEKSHGYGNIQGDIPVDGEILIVDDFVSSGATIMRMLMAAELLDEADRVTVFLYQGTVEPSWAYLRQILDMCDDGDKVPYDLAQAGIDTLDLAYKVVDALEAINWVTL